MSCSIELLWHSHLSCREQPPAMEGSAPWGTETPLTWKEGEKKGRAGSVSHLFRQEAIKAWPGRARRGGVCSQVAHLLLWMGKNCKGPAPPQRCRLLWSLPSTCKLSVFHRVTNRGTLVCSWGAKRESESITVHRAPAVSVISNQLCERSGWENLISAVIPVSQQQR